MWREKIPFTVIDIARGKGWRILFYSIDVRLYWTSNDCRQFLV
jgi:hypothetical protein